LYQFIIDLIFDKAKHDSSINFLYAYYFPTTYIRAFGLILGGSFAVKFRLKKIDGRIIE
jgi:hypothetical protein